MCRCEIETRIPDTNEVTDNSVEFYDTTATASSSDNIPESVNNLKVCRTMRHKASTESFQQADVSAWFFNFVRRFE